MLLAAFGFAAMGVCVKLAARTQAVSEIVFYRSLIALALSWAVLRWQRLPLATPEWRLQLGRGLSGFASLAAYFYAIALLPLATAVTLNYTSPLFFAILLWGFGGVAWRPAMSTALVAGFVGVAWLLQPTLSGERWLGGMVGLASGAGAGVAYFSVRALGRRHEPIARTVFYFSLISTIGGLLWCAGAREFRPMDGPSALLLLGVGLFATMAQLAMTQAYKAGDALLTASLAYSAVIFASLFGIILWGETLRPDAWLAIALIVASGIASTALARRRAPMPAAAGAAEDYYSGAAR